MDYDPPPHPAALSPPIPRPRSPPISSPRRRSCLGLLRSHTLAAVPGPPARVGPFCRRRPRTHGRRRSRTHGRRRRQLGSGGERADRRHRPPPPPALVCGRTHNSSPSACASSSCVRMRFPLLGSVVQTLLPQQGHRCCCACGSGESASGDGIELATVGDRPTVQAVKAALHMLENGACIEDAKSVCAPSDLFQLAKWKNKLNIFLAPFLHGMRYTSYGRHLTKLDKLQLANAFVHNWNIGIHIECLSSVHHFVAFGYCALNTRIEQRAIVVFGSNNPYLKPLFCSSSGKNLMQGTGTLGPKNLVSFCAIKANPVNVSRLWINYSGIFEVVTRLLTFAVVQTILACY